MNRAEYKIWQAYRANKTQRDLNELRLDFEKRGLFRSGMRQEAEDHLLKESRLEIEMEREKMEEYEDDKKITREDRNRQTAISAFVAGAALAGSIASIISAAIAFLTIYHRSN
ncbi:MAG: hypothetical protein PHT12_04685 [Patescibacteria group bacterium]|nr:hypothetical protein [Patescibacteria group bacterium]